MNQELIKIKHHQHKNMYAVYTAMFGVYILYLSQNFLLKAKLIIFSLTRKVSKLRIYS